MRRISTLCVIYGSVLCSLPFVVAAQTQNTTTIFQYDDNGNLTSITDPLQQATSYSYDELNRRVTVTDPKGGIFRLAYDPLNQLIGATDARNLSTIYSIDSLGNLMQQVSPDTGMVSYTYDEAGNIKTRTDAKSQTTSYQFDALNRMVGIAYADGTAATYRYDLGLNALGHLTQIVDAISTTDFTYDQLGQILSETRTIDGKADVTEYRYDAAGRLASITYPSGRQLVYERDVMGRVSKITSIRNGVTIVVVSEVKYAPFGGVQSYINSAGTAVVRGMDQSGRIVSYTLNGQLHSLSYDGAGNIDSHSDDANPANNASYAYDPAARLTAVTTTSGNLGFGYDANGNRLWQVNGANVTNSSIAAGSNQLLQISGATTSAVVSDANGSVTDNGNAHFTYDARGRLASATTAVGQVQYKVNAQGQRVQKIAAGVTTLYQYDSNGKLISERTGSAGRDYIYLGDIPVALIQF